MVDKKDEELAPPKSQLNESQQNLLQMLADLSQSVADGAIGGMAIVAGWTDGNMTLHFTGGNIPALHLGCCELADNLKSVVFRPQQPARGEIRERTKSRIIRG